MSKINPVYGIETAKVESFTFKLKDGKTMTAIPQGNQYQFYANKGVAKILGVLEQTGNILDFVNILKWGMNSSDKKELLPLPGPISVLNLPMKDYFDNIDEAIEEHAIRQLEIAKKEGIAAVRKVVQSNIHQKMMYRLIEASNNTVKRILNNEIKTIDKVMNAVYEEKSNDVWILYRIIEQRSGCIAMIDTFFFEIN